ncbi:LuxR C-terminal-related transcriptional regulator [Actinomadura sp. SCN-SB]|uniref:helix-turn-helix transcriptional regulator n=1 Tax=Actinomadura sp. SCN-SB TaxID=3373092 RepID=UPI00375221DB
MEAEAEQTANRLLKGIVSDDLLDPYIRLLEQNGCVEAEAQDLVGSRDAVEALTSSGMAHFQPEGPGLPARLVPVAPELALQVALAELSRQLVRDHERVTEGQRRLTETPPSLGSCAAGPLDRLVRILTEPSEISDTSRALIGTARRHWLTLENFVMERPLEELAAMPPPPSFDGEVVSRTVYEASCIEHPVGAKMVQIHVDAGDQARIVPRIRMKMKMADEAIALLPLTPTGLSGALLIRSSVVVSALREYFELMWERGIPLGAAKAEVPLSPARRQILTLLAQDLSDETISRRTGLSVTTVRRHITAIREKLGVESRFAAGVAAVRRGWLD